MHVRVVIVQTEDELKVCLDIRRRVFVEEQQVPIEEEIDDQDAVGVGHHVYIEDENGRPVATARYKPYGDVHGGTAKIQRVAVLRSYRKGGYGRAVMAAIEALALADGFNRAVLDAQCHAEGFYHKLGYCTVSDEPFYDAGILHVRMEKALRQAPVAR
nr:GNAT family N-acetyltransferase [Alicyclobacillus sacchari]